MGLYGLAALVLVLGAVLTALVFISYRKRLASVSDESDMDLELVKSIFSSTPIEKAVGYAFVLAIVYLIYQTIIQGFDFALLIIGATVFTGLIWLIDRQLTQRKRVQVLDKANEQIDGFEEEVNPTVLEPGLIENARSFFPILVFVFVLRSFLVEPFQIPSSSMLPTLEVRDFILVNRFAYGVRMPVTNKVMIPVAQPERGDVIVFKPPHEPKKNYIKRVVAIPGDLIQYDYDRKILRINGEVVNKEFIARKQIEGQSVNHYTELLPGRDHEIYTLNARSDRRPDEWIPLNGVMVPEGKYFVMGDNRDNSLDARYWEGKRRRMMGDFTNSGNNAWGFVDENAILGEAFVIWMHWEGFYPSFSRAGKIQ